MHAIRCPGGRKCDIKFKYFCFRTNIAVFCDNVALNDGSCRLFRCRKEQGTASEIMEMGDISRWQNQPD
jgi:hypothetical protein